MKKETIKKVKKWLEDFEQETRMCSEADMDTYEGSAYSLFQSILKQEKEKGEE